MENVNVGHSKFLAEASSGAKWRESEAELGTTVEDFDEIRDGKGLS